ncbi:MAG: DUF5615 family PIN-like protein [Hyphomicrobiaceae bacterium]|nr:DUF5615 family PIN-like protein [Hyphomicrobiaceae bacterium]
MRFLIDAQLPRDLAKWMKARGFRADHVFDLLSPNAEDDAIWALAVQLNAAIMTKDEDFIHIRTLASVGPSIVWLRIGNATTLVLFNWLAPRLDNVVKEVGAGTPVIEVL